MLLFLTLVTVAGPPVEVVAPSSHIEFLGFSGNERVTAWRVAVEATTEAGDTDRFELIKCIDVETNRIVATFRSGSIRRTDASGRRVHAPIARLLAANPTFREAASPHLWATLKRQGRFAFKQFEFKDTVVRLMPDDDAPAQVEGEAKQLKIAGRPGTPLGYVPIARLSEGGLLPLGHFRREASDRGALRATLRAYYPHTGTRVALVNQFYVGNAPVGPAQALLIRTDPNDPIGATGIGTLEMIEEQNRSFERTFKAMHPSRAKDYDEYLGKAY